MEQIKEFLLNLRFIFIPSFWDMQLTYVKGYDTKIKRFIDGNCKVYFNGQYTTKLVLPDEEIILWTGNYPYAYGNIYMKNNYRPSRDTIICLANYIAENAVDEPNKYNS